MPSSRTGCATRSKRWSRFRLATGCAFATICAGALALSRFSAFLAERHPGIADETGITRPVLEDYLSWLLAQGYSAATRALSLQHAPGVLRRLPPPRLAARAGASAVIYVEELPFHHDQVARFIPEFVMAQLESDAALDRLPFTTTRNLVVVLIETGLRGGDACDLPFNPILDDSAGWPCLRFEATKVRAEQLIPLSAKAAAAIRAQQDHVREHWPAGSPWLFPGITGNDDGSKPYSHSAFGQQLAHWQRVIGLRDEAGQPVTVTAHQFRHTLGTRLINGGVPQHVVQKLLGHASPHMTAHYARVHDATIRDDVRPLPAPAGRHRRPAPRLRPRRAHRGRRMGQAQPVPHPRQPAQRLLRPAAAAGLPAPQRLPDLPRLPDHARVPGHPPPAGRHQPAPDRPRRRQRPVPASPSNLRQVQASLERIIPALEALPHGSRQR